MKTESVQTHGVYDSEENNSSITCDILFNKLAN